MTWWHCTHCIHQMFFTHWCPGWARKHNSDALLLTPYCQSQQQIVSREATLWPEEHVEWFTDRTNRRVLSFSSQNDRTSRTNYQQHNTTNAETDDRPPRADTHMLAGHSNQGNACTQPWQNTLTHLRQSAPSLTDTGLPLHACVQPATDLSPHSCCG